MSAGLLFLGLINEQVAFNGLDGILRVNSSPQSLFGEICEQANGDAVLRDITDAIERKFAGKVDQRFIEIARQMAPTVRVRDVRVLPIGVIEIADAIAARKAARARKDFRESDRIRDELLAKGIVLKDGPEGTTWEVKR